MIQGGATFFQVKAHLLLGNTVLAQATSLLTVQRCDSLVHIGKVTQANFHVNDPVLGIGGGGPPLVGDVEGRLALFLPPAETQELAHRGRGQEMC